MDRRRVDPIIAAAPSASLTTNWLGSRIVSSPADQDAVVELDRVLVLRRRAVGAFHTRLSQRCSILLRCQFPFFIEEHCTDTAGFTDHVFALLHLLGFRFAPRIRDLSHTKRRKGWRDS